GNADGVFLRRNSGCGVNPCFRYCLAGYLCGSFPSRCIHRGSYICSRRSFESRHCSLCRTAFICEFRHKVPKSLIASNCFICRLVRVSFSNRQMILFVCYLVSLKQPPSYKRKSEADQAQQGFHHSPSLKGCALVHLKKTPNKPEAGIVDMAKDRCSTGDGYNQKTQIKRAKPNSCSNCRRYKAGCGCQRNGGRTLRYTQCGSDKEC